LFYFFRFVEAISLYLNNADRVRSRLNVVFSPRRGGVILTAALKSQAKSAHPFPHSYFMRACGLRYLA